MKRGAYLTPGVTFTIVNEITNIKKRFSFDGGIRTWLRNIVAEQRAVSTLHYVNEEAKECLVEVAFQYVDSIVGNIYSYVNNIPTIDGGTHEL
jgi:DNA gyrase subunit B